MPARRTLDELALRYRIGRVDTREIYVEGIQDKIILDHLLDVRGIKAAVYTADTVEIPHVALISRGLDAPSARSSVIAARCELLVRGVDMDDHIFLVDRDQEDLVATPFIDGCLITDFGSLPTHLMNGRSLAKLVRLAGRGLIAHDVLERSIHDISIDLYLIRAASKIIGIPLRILSPAPYICKTHGNGYSLQFDDYLRSCLHSCNLICREVDLQASVAECRRRLILMDMDPRVFINDHELWIIVKSIFKLAGDSVNRSVEDVRDLFMMSLDVEDLVGTPVFEKIFSV